MRTRALHDLRARRADGRLGNGLVASWLALLVAVVVASVLVLGNDYREKPPVADQVSHAFAALSLAYAPNTLNFDQQDLDRWRDLEWPGLPTPQSLIFQRYDDDLYAAAKPYGYPLYVAPFVRVLGFRTGVNVANWLLLMALVAGCILVLSTRYRGSPVVPLTTLAFVFGSALYAYAFPIHTELFLAVVTLATFACAWRYVDTARLRWALAFAALAAFLVAEKNAVAVILASPVALLLVWRAPDLRSRAAIVGTGVVAVAVAVLPYLVYSDFTSIVPYSGERLQLVVQPGGAPLPPFGGGNDVTPAAFESNGLFTSTITDISVPADQLESLGYLVFGRYTGLLAFAPLALLILLASIRSLGRRNPFATAVFVGVVGYAVAYVVLFPSNYYGGGHSFGNRYFFQIAPAVIVLAVAAGLRSRVMVGLGLAAIVLAVAFQSHNYTDPSRAFYTGLLETNAVQRVLPLEANQDYTDFLRTGR